MPERPTPCSSIAGDNTDVFDRSWRGSAIATPSGYTPSESGQTIVTENEPHDAVVKHLETIHANNKTIQSLRDEVQRLNAQLLISIPPPPKITRVAIKSVLFKNRYVQMDGQGLKSFDKSGGGRVGVQTFIAGWETFELVRHPEENVVSFKAVCFDNLYIRADPDGLQEGSSPGCGGGIINCQYGCGTKEKFRLRRAGEQGELAIESVEFSGRYLRMDGNDLDGINLQGVITLWEKFHLMVVL